MAKYYRQVFEVEVLGTEPLGVDAEEVELNGFDLSDIHEAITNGHHSGVLHLKSTEEVSDEAMQKLLVAQGSDPTFLNDPMGDDSGDDPLCLREDE